MILLIGGTSETAPIASAIAERGSAVLVSTATDVPLDIGDHPLIARRKGRLDRQGMVDLVTKMGVTAIVDAAHPYAVAAHETVQDVVRKLAIPSFVFRRPDGIKTDAMKSSAGEAADTGDSRETAGMMVRFAENHEEAADLAFAGGRPVLLTIGSKNLAPYTRAARRTGVPLVARVLDAPESVAACREAGIPVKRVIAGRGPFSFDENMKVIKDFGIGTVVTKESGKEGGIEAKLAAAQAAQCRLVVIRRPPPVSDTVFDTISSLLEAVEDHLASLKQIKPKI